MSDNAAEKEPGLLRVLGRVVLFMFGCALALAVASGFVPKLSGMWSELWLGSVTSVVAFGLTTIFVGWDGIRLGDVGAAPNQWSPVRLLVGFLIGLALVTLWAFLSAAGGYVRWSFEPEAGCSTAVIVLAAYLALACREELSFHGYPLRRWEQRFGVWGAQLFVALVFALEHRLGGWRWSQAAFGAGVGSVLFGMASIATRGLAVPIGMHAAWNFGTWLLGTKGQPGVWRGIVEPSDQARADLAGTLAYVILAGLATLAFWFYYRHKGNVRTIAAN
jgi:membrane protease YdiL (CAAX protease family)